MGSPPNSRQFNKTICERLTMGYRSLTLAILISHLTPTIMDWFRLTALCLNRYSKRHKFSQIINKISLRFKREELITLRKQMSYNHNSQVLSRDTESIILSLMYHYCQTLHPKKNFYRKN